MSASTLRFATTAAIAGALSLGLPHATQADPVLPGLVNLNFLDYTGSAPKADFGTVDPVGWTGGSGLIYIDAPGTSNTSLTTACGPTYLQTYGCPSTLAIPGGYNYVEADGNPDFESGFNYTVTGLTVGQTYSLTFYQAASQQTTFSGATTNQWIVSLGTQGLQDSISGTNGTYYNLDGTASIAATALMSVPSGGLVDWEEVTVNLTADATTDILSFLAWGDNGSTINEPPIAFLAGVDTPGFAPPAETPEPSTLALFGAGLLGLGWLTMRRRAKGGAAA